MALALISLGQIATFAVATVRLTGGTATLSGIDQRRPVELPG